MKTITLTTIAILLAIQASSQNQDKILTYKPEINQPIIINAHIASILFNDRECETNQQRTYYKISVNAIEFTFNESIADSATLLHCQYLEVPAYMEDELATGNDYRISVVPGCNNHYYCATGVVHIQNNRQVNYIRGYAYLTRKSCDLNCWNNSPFAKYLSVAQSVRENRKDDSNTPLFAKATSGGPFSTFALLTENNINDNEDSTTRRLLPSVPDNQQNTKDLLGASINYLDGNIKRMVEKYIKPCTTKEYKPVKNEQYNASFDTLFSQLRNSGNTFNFEYVPGATESSLTYDGKELTLTINNPSKQYGAKDGPDAKLFELTKLANLFLNGQILFENKKGRWEMSSSLKNEVAAKMFVINNFDITDSCLLSDTYADEPYAAPTELGYLKNIARNASDKYTYLARYATIDFFDIDDEKTIKVKAAIPGPTSKEFKNVLKKPIQDKLVFGYPQK